MPLAAEGGVSRCDALRPVTHELALRVTIPAGERLYVAAESPTIDARNISVGITLDCEGTRCVDGVEPPAINSAPRTTRYRNETDRPQTVFVRLGTQTYQGAAPIRALVHVGAAQENRTCVSATDLAVDGPALTQWAPDFPSVASLCSSSTIPLAFYRLMVGPGEAIAVRVDGQRSGANFFVNHGCGTRCSVSMTGTPDWPLVLENSTSAPVEGILLVQRAPMTAAPFLISAQRVSLDPHASCERPFALTPEQQYTLDPSREGLTPRSLSCNGATPSVYFRADLPARSTRWLVVRAAGALPGRARVSAARFSACEYQNCGGSIFLAGATAGSLPLENTSDSPVTQLVSVGRAGVTVPLTVSLSLTEP